MNIINKLLGSKVKIEILRTLFKYPNDEFSLNYLARVSKVNPASVWNSVDDLFEMGIINKKVLTSATNISLNINSKYYRHLKPLFESEKKK